MRLISMIVRYTRRKRVCRSTSFTSIHAKYAYIESCKCFEAIDRNFIKDPVFVRDKGMQLDADNALWSKSTRHKFIVRPGSKL